MRTQSGDWGQLRGSEESLIMGLIFLEHHETDT
jgi:hypothetical protein